MRRVQLQLTDEQIRAIEGEAASSGRPFAAVAREAIELWRSQLERHTRIEPAVTATGGFRSGLHDVAERHDDYLLAGLEEEVQERWG